MTERPKLPTIFVGIASYRDKVCTRTVQNLFERAKFPERVHVGICQQNLAEYDTDCYKGAQVDPKYSANIKIMRLNAKDAKGPTHARYLCTTLFDDQDFFFQIDSHTLFVKDWDQKLIDQWNKIKSLGLSKKPILSHYPKEYSDYKESGENDGTTTMMCKAFFNDQQQISFEGAAVMPNPTIPRRHAFIAGGMFFVEKLFLDEVRFDPELPYLFVLEEIGMSARAYTFGYDVFNPTEDICFHAYTRESEPKYWNEVPKFDDTDAVNKVKWLLGLDSSDNVPDYLKNNACRFALGKERSIDDFWKFIGADFEHLKVTRNFCEDDANVSHFPNGASNYTVSRLPGSLLKSNKTVIFIMCVVVIVCCFVLVYGKLS